MDQKTVLLLVAGLIVTAVAFAFSIYAGGIVFIILAAIVMTRLIMQDTLCLPDVVAELRDDAREIIIRNAGNAAAKKIHVALVPENIEFDIESLRPDMSASHPLEKMIGNARAVVTFENEKGEKFSRTYHVSSDGSSYDPLKPMIPLFGWK